MPHHCEGVVDVLTEVIFDDKMVLVQALHSQAAPSSGRTFVCSGLRGGPEICDGSDSNDASGSHVLLHKFAHHTTTPSDRSRK